MESFQPPILWDSGFQSPVTAGNVFATLTPPAGFYHIHIDRVAYGTGQPQVPNNSRLNIGDVSYTLATAAALDVNYDFDFYTRLDGNTVVSVTAINNGSASIGVTVGLGCWRIG